MIFSIVHFATIFNLATAAVSTTSGGIRASNRHLQGGCEIFNNDKWGCQGAEGCAYDNPSKQCTGNLVTPSVSVIYLLCLSSDFD